MSGLDDESVWMKETVNEAGTHTTDGRKLSPTEVSLVAIAREHGWTEPDTIRRMTPEGMRAYQQRMAKAMEEPLRRNRRAAMESAIAAHTKWVD